ncbi:hypothetical protein PQX77_011585 [Marasmius sp. AFHP31]|nr:hypothetical protein PQX77_011585 [Marasmius sp. AFHP31]
MAEPSTEMDDSDYQSSRSSKNSEAGLETIPDTSDAPSVGAANLIEAAESQNAEVPQTPAHSGFPTLGNFLMNILREQPFRDQSLSKTVSAFIRCTSIDVCEHPVAIVDLIFNHAKACLLHEGPTKYDTFTGKVTVPKFASVLLNTPSPIPEHDSSKSTTQHTLIDWALQRTIDRINTESETLRVHSYLTRTPGVKIAWDMITRFDFSTCQNIILETAPALLSVTLTAACSNDVQDRLSRLAADSKSSPTKVNGELDMRQDIDTVAWETMEEEDGPETVDSEDRRSGAPNMPEAPKMWRNPLIGVTVAILMFMFFRYRLADVFPTLMGVFFFTCNANRDMFSILRRVGLCLSYSAVLANLNRLAEDADRALRAIGQKLEDSGPTFLLLFDNINKMKRAWQQALGHIDTMRSGTAATLIRMVDVPAGALRLDNLRRHQRRPEANKERLTIKMLQDDISWSHMREVGQLTILRRWIKHISTLSRFRSKVEKAFVDPDNTTIKKHRLSLRKSEIYTMRTSDLEESTAEGVMKVLVNLIAQLGVVPRWLLAWSLFICGDQLTVDRVRRLPLYCGKVKGYGRHDWALPVIQLWHLKWNWQKAIFRILWKPDSKVGLCHDTQVLLERCKFNHEKCDFYQAHHILEDRFDALVLHSLRLVVESERSISISQASPLLGGLETIFAPGGSLGGITYEELSALADLTYRRYMCNAAHDEARHPSLRETKVYGAEAKQQAERDEGDRVLANDITFLRVTFWYMELCAAIAEGDIGRVMEVIKLLRFSFWGAGSTNYGNELLELACNFLIDFPRDLVEAILNNWLVNPSGKPGNWFELDLLQEHFNFWIKRLFNSKSHEFDSKHLSEAVSLNIVGFSRVRDTIPRMFGVKRNGSQHTDPKKTSDINRLGQHFVDNKILQFVHDREHMGPDLVPNEFSAGVNILRKGQLRTYLDRLRFDGKQCKRVGGSRVINEPQWFHK